MGRFSAWLLLVLSLTCINADEAWLTAAFKCQVCEAVVEEVQDGFDKFSQGMNLDLRARLDGRGKRHGKVIEYKHSEARCLEVIEHVCSNMTDYTMSTNRDGSKQVIKINNNNGRTITISGSMTISEFETRELGNQCGLIVEEAEESLMPWMQRGCQLSALHLCVDLLGVCSPSDEVCLPSPTSQPRPSTTVGQDGTTTATTRGHPPPRGATTATTATTRGHPPRSEAATPARQVPANPAQWNANEVASWMERLQLEGGLPAACKENAITGELLRDIGSTELLELGVKKVGQRMRLVRAISELFKGHTKSEL